VLLLAATVLSVTGLVACTSEDEPTDPGPALLDVAGDWSTDDLSGPCEQEAGEDWSRVALVLRHSDSQISGEIVTADGRRRPVGGGLVTVNGVESLRLGLLDLSGTSTCYSYELWAATADMVSSGGRVVRIPGHAYGRCCGTVSESFTLEREG